MSFFGSSQITRPLARRSGIGAVCGDFSAGSRSCQPRGWLSVGAVREASDAGEEGCRKVADDVTPGFNAVLGMQRQIHFDKSSGSVVIPTHVN